jgi:hypothetical protein
MRDICGDVSLEDLEAGDLLKAVSDGKGGLRLTKLSAHKAAEVERNVQLVDFSASEFHAEPMGKDGYVVRVSVQFVTDKQFVDAMQELCQFYDKEEQHYIKYAVQAAVQHDLQDYLKLGQRLQERMAKKYAFMEKEVKA